MYNLHGVSNQGLPGMVYGDGVSKPHLYRLESSSIIQLNWLKIDIIAFASLCPVF